MKYLTKVAILTWLLLILILASGASAPLTEHSTRRSRYDMLSIVEFANIFTYICTTNASMTLDAHVISQSKHDLKHWIIF